MSFQNLVLAAQKHFPNVKIKYKDKSLLMKILGKIMFFSPGFVASYTTTIGNTIYFPSEHYTKIHPVTCYVLLLHEVVHIYDENRLGKIPFLLSYLFPQILLPLACLLFLISWKITIPVLLLLAAPIPAVWRTHYEKRAYLTSIYSMSKLGKLLSFDPHLDARAKYFSAYFKDSTYYFMWPFDNINREFNQAVAKIRNDRRPYLDDALFDIIDDLVASCRSS